LTAVDSVGTASTSRPRLGGGPFFALRSQPYRWLWVSGLAVFLSVMAQSIARAWLAFELTGTNAGLGGVLLGFGLPMLVATPWGGVAADRLSKRAVLATAVALLALTSGAIGLAVALDAIEYWMLVVTSGVQAVAFALYGPARMAFITELVDEGAVPNAIVLGQMSAEAMRVAGPAIAGVVIGAWTFGVEAVFLAGTVLTVVGMVTLVRLPPGHAPAGRPTRSPWAELADGMAYVRADPALRLLVLTSLGVVMVGFPYLAFLPTVAEDLFDVGSSGYGVMSAVSAAGAVVAGLVSPRLAGRRDPWQVLFGGGLVFGAAIVGLGLAPWYGLVLVILPVVGGAGLTFQTTNQSLLLELAEFEYHGRIQGLVMLGFSGFGIAALPLGVLADAIGLRTTFVLMGGAVIALVVASTLRSDRVRHRLTALDLA
jgi:MFS family permease